jgi:hypothetical protein
MLFRIVAPHFVAGLEVDGKFEVVRAAPILAWTVGKQWDDLCSYFDRKKWRCESLKTTNREQANG